MTKSISQKQPHGEHVSLYVPPGTKELIDKVKDPYISRSKFFLKVIDQLLKEQQEKQNEK